MTDRSLTESTQQVTTQAQVLIVTDSASFCRAGEFMLTLKALEKQITGVFGPIIAASHHAHQEALAQQKALLAPVQAARGYLDDQTAAYLDQEARQRAAREAALTAEAERQAEAAQVAEAARLEQDGRRAEAEAVLAAPPIVAPIILDAPQAAGVSSRMDTHAVVTDLPALIRAVAAGTVPLAALLPNLPYLNGQAKALKGLLRYPGVQVVIERVMVTRGPR